MLGMNLREVINYILSFAGLGAKARFRKALLDVARSQLGVGEQDKNNHGPVVAEYASSVGMKPPILWCAAFVSWVYYQACALTGRKPHKLGRANAKRLGNAVLDFGGKLIFDEADGLLEAPKPGDLLVWHRGDSAFSGHVGIVTSYDAKTGDISSIDGNRGRFPSVVREYTYNIGYADLYRIVRFPELS